MNTVSRPGHQDAVSLTRRRVHSTHVAISQLVPSSKSHYQVWRTLDEELCKLRRSNGIFTSVSLVNLASFYSKSPSIAGRSCPPGFAWLIYKFGSSRVRVARHYETRSLFSDIYWHLLLMSLIPSSTTKKSLDNEEAHAAKACHCIIDLRHFVTNSR